MTAKLLPTRTVAKPWGCDTLPAPFAAPAGERIGEIWFEPDAALPDLLVKYLFTCEKLSVQVHPGDAQAPFGSRGKEECWLVLNAEPDARLAIGFREPVSAEAMHAAALDGSIEHLLEWHGVQAGDFFYLPAGTVHAIGPGLALIEIQQNSDITYRLYDYGRPRELHLDEAVAVAAGEPHPPAMRRRLGEQESAVLVDGPHFRLERLCGLPDAGLAARFPAAALVVPVRGNVTAGGLAVAAGQCAQVSSLRDIGFDPKGEALVAAPI
ncbi:class I mannose-6-phosphate isomerase [Altererythrobacter sp. H2]|uniref:class I mannose-6-phosphate isomerase n=1 Tax=Altererythrobacter sp. H2 TaxID=3108391 RepID=UPI002B4BA973|nr:class I mannose-6-phosphate isomerase [Altererythrobacter sp. H2]WRK96576.1 class I mannose-6-phosphate isomerase [Altererythrobacter sp. H2]